MNVIEPAKNGHSNRNRWKKTKHQPAVRLGDITNNLMKKYISPRWDSFRRITSGWESVSSELPDELVRHCRIAGISGGQITIAVDMPSYRYEMQLRSPELLRCLQQQCPADHIKKIKLISD